MSSSSTPDNDAIWNLQSLISDSLPPELTESEAFQSELKDLNIFREKLCKIPVFSMYGYKRCSINISI